MVKAAGVVRTGIADVDQVALQPPTVLHMTTQRGACLRSRFTAKRRSQTCESA